MAPQMTRINLDFLVKHTKKITKITTELNKTHTYTTQLTHIQRHTTTQHSTTAHTTCHTAPTCTQYCNPGNCVHQRYARWAQRGGPETE